jgi:hypothetical protein
VGRGASSSATPPLAPGAFTARNRLIGTCAPASRADNRAPAHKPAGRPTHGERSRPAPGRSAAPRSQVARHLERITDSRVARCAHGKRSGAPRTIRGKLRPKSAKASAPVLCRQMYHCRGAARDRHHTQTLVKIEPRSKRLRRSAGDAGPARQRDPSEPA